MLRLGAVGDVVRTLPAASALRRAYPDAHLAWLVEPGSESLLSAQPWLDEVIVFPRTRLRDSLRQGRWWQAAREIRELARLLRAGRFDLVADFHSILKSGLLSFATRAPRRVGYARPFGREGAWLFANQRVQVHPRRISRFERNRVLVEALGIQTPPAERPLTVEPAASERMARALGEGPAPLVIHPGTSDATRHKRYSASGYAALARALARDPGIPSIVTLGPARDDRVEAEAVVKAAEGAARLGPETSGLPDLAALFARCRLFAGADSGPLHVASLVGTPVVQILGPTDPVENAPYAGTPSRTVLVPVACHPCGRRGCAAATCMRVLPPERVIAAARQLLAVPRPGW
ncbi:MAG: glycosyltransferase family 9 protein [Myxococcota bacterium]